MYALDERMRELEAEMAQPAGRAAAMREYDDVLARVRRGSTGGRSTPRSTTPGRTSASPTCPQSARFGDLSGGEQARVMLAGVLLGRPTILLLDEPTNHLDLGGLRWLERFLGAFPGGVLVVSHDRRFLDNTVSRILELDGVSDELASLRRAATRRTGPRSSAGSSACSAEFRAQDAYRRRLEADIARAKSQALSVELTVIRGAGAPHVRKIAKRDGPRRRRCASAASQRQMQQAEWIADPAKAPSFTLSLDGVSTRGRRIAALEGVSVELGGRHGPRRTSTWPSRAASGSRSSARTAPARRRSCGCSRGTLAPRARPRARRRRDGGPPADAPRPPARARHPRLLPLQVVSYEEDARAFLGHFLFDQEQMHRPIGTLSPGERSRLLIAVLVSSGAELLLLDEPTNHLDFDSIDVVEEALRQFRGTIVAVTPRSRVHPRDRLHPGPGGEGTVRTRRRGPGPR